MSDTIVRLSQAECFHRDLDSINRVLTALHAVRSTSDGFQYIDATAVPESLLTAYQNLLSFGYANGYMQ